MTREEEDCSVVGRLLFLFQPREGGEEEVETGRAKFTWPSLVLGLVFFSYNTSSLARPAMAASDGLSSAIFQ